MLAELIAPLGLAVGWVGLAAQLRRSNLASTVAREEERRRLRRDFHDGLGPALTGVSLGLRTAVRQLERSPNAACLAVPRELLDRIADEVDALIEEVKRIARDLRPTALDQFGLAAAVSELTRSFGEVLEFRLSLPDTAIDLPAAVEVATYRIVSEAVTNVVRHAHASCCWLTISVDDDVDIDVSDDGGGIAAATAGGIGWAAMKERAFELGGVCSIESRESSGTRVHVRLPLVVA
jgi:signal transduction histidine kinase